MDLSEIEVCFPDLMKIDGFDDAIIGLGQRIGLEVLCYDTMKIIEILKKDMPEEDAWDYFQFNIEGAWVGEKSPIFIEFIEKKATPKGG
jgi:hypothetical protein